METISYFTACSLFSFISKEVFCTILSLIWTLKFFPFCPVSVFFFQNSSYFQGLQWLDEETKERNCRVSDICHEIFLSLIKPWLKRLPFMFQEYQSISTSSLNEWSYLTTLGNDSRQRLLGGSDMSRVFARHLASPGVDIQTPVSPGRTICKIALRTQCSFKHWIT